LCTIVTLDVKLTSASFSKSSSHISFSTIDNLKSTMAPPSVTVTVTANNNDATNEDVPSNSSSVSTSKIKQTTSDSKLMTSEDNELIRKLRRLAPQPWGTKWLDQCRLLSPFTWLGVATIRKIDIRPILTSLMGIVLPALVYQLAKGSGLLAHAALAAGQGSNNNSISASSRWSLSADIFPDSLLIPYMMSPWTLGLIWRASPAIRNIWSGVEQVLSMQAITQVAAWQSLVDGVESGRVYRTRRYDVYLPPPLTNTAAATTAASKPQHAILFLPGGGVQHVAYSSPATLLSNAGYLVVVVSAEPLRMGLPELGTTVAAMRRIQQTVERRHAFPITTTTTAPTTTIPHQKMTWALLGHSMGSFTACQLAEEFCKSNMGDDDDDTSTSTRTYSNKVVMWGSAPFVDYLPDLSGHQRLPILVVQGSRDAIIEAFSTVELTKEFWQRLPEDTAEQVVAGGTHSGFADYVSLWTKKEEGGIPNEEQHRQAVQATVDFLQKE
jgi:predicted Rdx family selenoprotein